MQPIRTLPRNLFKPLLSLACVWMLVESAFAEKPITPPLAAPASGGVFPTLEIALRSLPPTELAALAQREGDPIRGAVVFFQHHMACSKCHSVGAEKPSSLGPDLATIDKQTTGAALVEAVLAPSQVIRKGYETLSVATTDGKIWTGLLVERTAEKVVLRDASRGRSRHHSRRRYRRPQNQPALAHAGRPGEPIGQPPAISRPYSLLDRYSRRRTDPVNCSRCRPCSPSSCPNTNSGSTTPASSGD